jgi:effector-binding domain-containing protein
MDQLMRLNRILALKDLGIDLSQISQLLDENLSSDEFRGMLRLRQVQLQQTIQAAQEQFARIEARIYHIEREISNVLPDVVLKSVRPIQTVSSYSGVSGFIPNLERANNFIAMLKRYRIKTDGYTHYLYHQNKSQGDDYDVEIAIPLARSVDRDAIESDSNIFFSQLPEVPKMASAVYCGSPNEIKTAYRALGLWIQHNGYTITGPCRKVCLRWTGNLNDYLTEIQFPVDLQ